MGFARWNASSWNSHAAKTVHKTQDQIFTSSTMHPDLDPKSIKVRESVDSQENPESTPIILCVDVTGSMGYLAEAIVKTDLGKIMEYIYTKKPVTDPHIMVAAVGDELDYAPLQVSQFESQVEPAVSQIEKIWLEGNGHGNGGESY